MIAIYARVSTNEQRKGESIKTQLAGIEHYCQSRGMKQTKTYLDDGVSGTIPLEHRPGGRRLLDDARQTRFDEVLIWKFDRLGRTTLGILQSIADLEAQGIRVTSITEPIDNTPGGRLHRTVLAGNAEYEPATTRERTVGGSRRLAQEGVWLGGIVPYGYRKAGEDKAARLGISTEPIPGRKESEADVIRKIFTMAAAGKSTVVIADHLNRIGVPPAYTVAGRTVLRGKRREATSGLWRPGRVRNLIVNTTYKGTHVYGKRRNVRDKYGHPHLVVNPPEALITRACPAIVEADLWGRANAAMHKNQILAMAHPKHTYLLRGLVKCGLCGLTYIGTATKRPNGVLDFYYRCNAKSAGRGPYGEKGQHCPNPSVRGRELEAAIWRDVEIFLDRPGLVLKQLKTKMAAQTDSGKRVAEEIGELEAALARQGEARERALTLFTQAVISRAELNQQLQRIADKRASIDATLAERRRYRPAWIPTGWHLILRVVCWTI